MIRRIREIDELKWIKLILKKEIKREREEKWNNR